MTKPDLKALKAEYDRLSDAHDKKPSKGSRQEANAAYTAWQKAREKLNKKPGRRSKR